MKALGNSPVRNESALSAPPNQSTRPVTKARRLVTGSLRLFVVAASVVALGGPFVLLGVSAFKSAAEVVQFPPTILPETWLWGNLLEAYELLGPRTFANSVVFTGAVVLLQTALGMTSGFVLAKMPIVGRTALLLMFVVTMLVPAQVTLIPTYIVVNQLGLVNTYGGLILPIVAQTGFGVFFFHQFFRGLPTDLIDAARIDGASWARIFRVIAVPLSKPAAAAYGAVTFLTAWNMYVWPLVAASSLEMRVLPVALAAIGAENTTIPINVGLSAVLLSTLPLAVVFVLAERWFVEGITGSGLKG